jgi:hypothetical protein
VALDPAEDPRFWFAIDLAIARRHNRRLAGAPAERVLPELPRALVLRALLDSIVWHRRSDDPNADAVASACRAWAWATAGHWRSKRAAADWSRRRAPGADPGAAAEAALTAQRAAAGPARPAGGG